MTQFASKLALEGARISVSEAEAVALAERIFRAVDCNQDTARLVSKHLVDASLSGVESHGFMRIIQYVERFETREWHAEATPIVNRSSTGVVSVDGRDGIGIPAMQLAFWEGTRLARENGISAVPVRDCGHTGRLGAYADEAAEEGFLTITLGGGNRERYRQVAPHGGRCAKLPTNPYCIGIPGGARGPVVLDFATGAIAGGWIYAAESAGGQLPEGAVIDRDGLPTRDPGDYFAGGAILPAGGAKGYAMSVVAELIADAMIGPVRTECNWFSIFLDTTRYRDPAGMTAVAEEILDDIRNCPPAPGFDAVQIPGERERALKDAANGTLQIPERTWEQIETLATPAQCPVAGTKDKSWLI